MSQTRLEDVTDGVEDCEVTVVAAISLITTEESRPLDIIHGHAASVTEEVASEHRGRERVEVVAASAALESLQTLLGSGAVAKTKDVGAVGRHRHAKLICTLEFSRHLFNLSLSLLLC